MGNEGSPAPGGLPVENVAVAEKLDVEVKPASITIDDFAKVDIRVGKILTAERVPKSKKLIKMEVQFDEAIGKRVILAGIGDHAEFSVDLLLNQCCLFVVNLPPREILKGFTSHGMLLSAKGLNGLYYPATCGTPFGPLGQRVG